MLDLDAFEQWLKPGDCHIFSVTEVRALVAELRAARQFRAACVGSDRLRLLADWLDLHDNDRAYRGPREVQDDLRRFADAVDAYDQLTEEPTDATGGN